MTTSAMKASRFGGGVTPRPATHFVARMESGTDVGVKAHPGLHPGYEGPPRGPLRQAQDARACALPTLQKRLPSRRSVKNPLFSWGRASEPRPKLQALIAFGPGVA